jgi:hypothetical protein
VFASIQGIAQMDASGLGLRKSGDMDDQHLKQDIKIYVEDLQDMLESKTP